jgi:PEP-CTERM/exosortase A-associated glycosyltransferase
LRILHILDHSLPLHSGYAFRTRAILKAQVEKGWEVAGITGARHTAEGPQVETIDGLTFYRSPKHRPAMSPLGEWREIAALEKGVEALVDISKPDLLHAHSPVLTALAGLRVARRHSLPLVYEIRAFWEDAAAGNGTGREAGLRYSLIREVETYAIARADAVTVICEGLKADLVARGVAADKIVVVPNGVDLGLFGEPRLRETALAETLGIGDAPTIGFIGSYYDYEGIDDLIAAMPALQARQPELHLLLVGGGPMEEALRQQADASPAAARIHFVGRVPHEAVGRYYSLIDILVYPRKRMRLTELVTPLKPLEAMAQKRLVAASDIGGHRELIEDGVTGTLFAPGNPAALAEAVAGLFEMPDRWEKRRLAARAFVERERNWSSNISRYAPVYHKLTGKPV